MLGRGRGVLTKEFHTGSPHVVCSCETKRNDHQRNRFYGRLTETGVRFPRRLAHARTKQRYLRTCRLGLAFPKLSCHQNPPSKEHLQHAARLVPRTALSAAPAESLRLRFLPCPQNPMFSFNESSIEGFNKYSLNKWVPQVLGHLANKSTIVCWLTRHQSTNWSIDPHMCLKHTPCAENGFAPGDLPASRRDSAPPQSGPGPAPEKPVRLLVSRSLFPLASWRTLEVLGNCPDFQCSLPFVS